MWGLLRPGERRQVEDEAQHVLRPPEVVGVECDLCLFGLASEKGAPGAWVDRSKAGRRRDLRIVDSKRRAGHGLKNEGLAALCSTS